MYERDKLADVARNGLKSLAQNAKISFTGGKKGGLYDLLLHWKQEQTGKLSDSWYIK